MNNTVYVLDTSILLAEGKRVLSSFSNTQVVIPLAVVGELEAKRNDPELGYPARSALRELDRLRELGDIKVGIDVGNGSTVRVELNHINHEDLAGRLPQAKSNDAKIISVAYSIQKEDPSKRVMLISKDIPLKLMGDLHGVKSRDLFKEPSNREFIDVVKEFEVSPEEINEIFENKVVKLTIDVPVNVGVVLKSGNSSALALAKPGYLFSLVPNQKLSGMEGRSKEQTIGMKQLTDDTIKSVSLGGRAGTGKTAMALAAGVDAIKNRGYKKIIVFRSMHAVGGEELGFLPGTEAEKLDPWTAAIYDALGSLSLPASEINYMKTHKQIEVLPITHVRGRTFNNAYIIVDEAQNLSKDTLMTLMTRVGHSSKIVLTHDVSQRDNIHVNRWEGIYEVVSRMHGNKLFAHTAMIKSERSELAQTVGDLLDDH